MSPFLGTFRTSPDVQLESGMRSGADIRLRLGPTPWSEPIRRSYLQPFLADGIVRLEFGRRALEHDAAVPHDVDPMRDPHRDRELLLHQQNGNAAPGDLGDEVADRLHAQGRETLPGVGDHAHFRVAPPRAA